MHENRETSGMPVGKVDGRPAGEGDSHTARMHVLEESDSGIVPMNHSNNQNGNPCAGINRHEAENARGSRERGRDPLGPECCAGRREVFGEAYTGV